MKDKISFEDIPNYGDLMPIEEFQMVCECGGFIDYDGFGNYAFENKMSNIETSPSRFLKNPDKRFTHIVWFNR
ncbi:hypothetical protein M0R04_05035 [Candidatus Dojkabacteria bacterium]|jgi:hypothetical protein|nr:hypothetical protein [Candidatus Dojkabacteria bacterium]